MVWIIISGFVCVIFCGNFLMCFVKSKDQYERYMKVIDKKEYGLKDFLPLGLWFCKSGIGDKLLPEKVKAIYMRYQNRILQKIIELRGVKYAQFYQEIHQAYRAALGIMVSAGASLAGFIMSVQGDHTNALMFSLAAVAAAIALPFLVDHSLDEEIAKRRLQIQLEFPEFVSKLTLLVNAGMTISRAWEKIINENQKDTILYREMDYALAEIQSGRPESVAYEEFARRCKVKEVTKFVSVIVMNLRRGGAEVIPVLRQQGDECWEMRKAAAKQMGEEAGTRILLPLMIMFVGIILIVATPAVLSFNMGM